MRRLLLVAGLGLATAGCSGPDTTALINALAQDKNQVCVTIVTLYGSASYSRNHGCDANAVEVPAAKVQ